MSETAPGGAGDQTAGAGDFLLVAGHGQLTTHVIEKLEIVIGRDAECDVVIDHPSMSRRHAAHYANKLRRAIVQLPRASIN